MTITLNGTTGITTPAETVTGTDVWSVGSTQIYKDTGGNVGIGTSSPSYKLDVSSSSSTVAHFYNSAGRGLCVVDGTSDSTFRVNRAGTQIGWFQSDSSGTEVNTGTTGAYPFAFYTNNTERMRIDSSGNLLVGTTTQTASARQTIAFLSSSGGTGISYIDSQANNTATFAGFYSNTTKIGSITNNGNSATAYNTSSDYRLKENIAPMTGALAKVAELKPCTYTWKESGIDGQGFIAHELQAVVPDCVTGEKDAVDADGKPIYQGIDTSFLVATLTAAIQELKAELDTVKTELATLKGTA